MSDLRPKPVTRMAATVQGAHGENHEEIGGLRDAAQQGIVEITFVKVDDIQKNAQAPLHQFFAQEESGGIAALTAVADEDVVLRFLAVCWGCGHGRRFYLERFVLIRTIPRLASSATSRDARFPGYPRTATTFSILRWYPAPAPVLWMNLSTPGTWLKTGECCESTHWPSGAFGSRRRRPEATQPR